MTRNFDDLFSTWIEDGPTRASDGVLEALRTDVARTPQRKPSLLRPRGDSAMNSFFKLGAVAAAGLAVVVVALFQLGGARPPDVGPAASSPPSAAAPAASSSIAASPAPTTTRYESDYLPWAIELPAGWLAGTAEGDSEGSYETFNRYQPTLVVAGIGSSRPPAGTPIEEWVRAGVDKELANAAGCGASAEPVETIMGGEPAFELFWGCDGRFFGVVITSHEDRRYVLLTDAAEEAPARQALDELVPAFEFTDDPGASSAPATIAPAASTNPAGSTSPAAPAAATRYESKWGPWVIDLPAGWVSMQRTDAQGYEYFNRYRPTLVLAEVVSFETGLDAPPADAESQLHGAVYCPEVTQPRPTETTMGGERAYRMACEGSDGRGRAVVVTYRGGFGYAIETEAADEETAAAAIDELMRGFEFTE